MTEALDVVRVYRAAFEKRDEERFLALVTEDVEFMNPLGNVVAVGRDGAREWLRQNEDEGVHVTPAGEPEVDESRVTWPMTMRIAATDAELPALGVFEIRDGRIARFEAKMRPR